MVVKAIVFNYISAIHPQWAEMTQPQHCSAQLSTLKVQHQVLTSALINML